MKAIFCLALGLLSWGFSSAQTRNVSFSYDAVGNRISRRELPVGASCRKGSPIRDSLPGSSITLYPNPTPNKVTIELKGIQDTASAECFMYDLSGKLLQQSRVTVGVTTQFSLEAYKAGTYILKLKKGESETIWRIVKID